jgi:hypothetical protein
MAEAKGKRCLSQCALKRWQHLLGASLLHLLGTSLLHLLGASLLHLLSVSLLRLMGASRLLHLGASLFGLHLLVAGVLLPGAKFHLNARPKQLKSRTLQRRRRTEILAWLMVKHLVE